MNPFATSALLSGLFVAVYGFTSWFASLHGHLGTLAFAWEAQIPFVPIMIIPYMSLDLFFVAAPFVCRDDAERRLLAKRITFAILVAGACFLVMPLQFAWPRPVPEGWLGGIYRFLHGFDRPTNLFPSLHIALRTILVVVYARHTRGLARFASHLWFSLIGLSTLLTYQHHLLDVAGGFILAAFSCYLFREEQAAAGHTNPRVGGYYALGALVCTTAGVWLWPFGALLLWPAAALALTALGYFGVIRGLFRKTGGRLPLVSRLLLAPVLLGHRLSLAWYRRRANPWDEVSSGLLIGRRLSDAEAKQVIAGGVVAVVDLTSEFSEAGPFRSLAYLGLPTLDLTAPVQADIDRALAFIRDQLPHGKVYVHCKIGYSRSASVVGAWLLDRGLARTTAEALALLRRARPSLIVRPEVVAVLEGRAAGNSRQPEPAGLVCPVN